MIADRAECTQEGNWYPGRIWSLLDMLKLEGDALIGALNSLSTLDGIAKSDPDWLYGEATRRTHLVNKVNQLIGQIEKLELRLATNKANHILGLIALDDYDNKTTAASVSSALIELRERIEQELEDRAIYYVPAREAALIKTSSAPFGPEVNDKFPDATSDLAEAANCLALSRNTAAVFHLMRCVEAAVLALGSKLEVTIIDKDNIELEWGKIIANMKAPIEAMPKGAERDSWSGAHSLLYHVKQAWRNSTMHPKQTYTGEEAREVFDAVRSFMRNLVSLV